MLARDAQNAPFPAFPVPGQHKVGVLADGKAGPLGSPRLPLVQQGFMERVSLQPVHRAVGGFAVIVQPGEDDGVVRSRCQDERRAALCGHLFQEVEPFPRLVDFHGVGRIPVAAHQHLAVRQGQGRRSGALAVQDALSRESVRSRVVDFHAPALADAEGLRTAPAQHHPPVRQERAESMVVRIFHGHLMPRAAFEVPGRGRQHKAVRMPAEKGHFPIQDHHIRGGQRLRQVRQTLRPAAGAPGARDGEKGEQYEEQALHAYKDKVFCGYSTKTGRTDKP